MSAAASGRDGHALDEYLCPDSSIMKRRLFTCACAAAVSLLSAGVARAEPDSKRNEISVGANLMTLTRAPSLVMPITTAEVAYHRSFDLAGRPEMLRVGAGARLATEWRGLTVPAEAFARAQLVAPVGPWKPALGVELGVSGLTRLFRAQEGTEYPSDLVDSVEPSLSPVYVAAVAAPLRFQFGRFTVSAAELQIGSTVTDLDGSLRLQFGLLQIGGTL